MSISTLKAIWMPGPNVHPLAVAVAHFKQFPDVEADRSIGRRHFPIAIGNKASSALYGVFLLLAYVSIIVGIILQLLPIWSALSLLTAFLAWRAYQGSRENAENIPALIPSMGINVIINLVTPVLLAVGLFIG